MNSSNHITFSDKAVTDFNKALADLPLIYHSELNAAAEVCREAVEQGFQELRATRARALELECQIEKWCHRLKRVTVNDLSNKELADMGLEAVAS